MSAIESVLLDTTVALEHNLPLATRDPHFSLVSGLTVLSWWVCDIKVRTKHA